MKNIEQFESYGEPKINEEVFKPIDKYSKPMEFTPEQVSWIVDQMGEYLRSLTMDSPAAYRVGRKELKSFFQENLKK